MEMTELSHQDSVWTWKSHRRASRASLWLPYFQGVSKLKGTKYQFDYKGGSVESLEA